MLTGSNIDPRGMGINHGQARGRAYRSLRTLDNRLEWLGFHGSFVTQPLVARANQLNRYSPALRDKLGNTLPNGITHSIPEPFHHCLCRRPQGAWLLFGL